VFFFEKFLPLCSSPLPLSYRPRPVCLSPFLSFVLPNGGIRPFPLSLRGQEPKANARSLLFLPVGHPPGASPSPLLLYPETTFGSRGFKMLAPSPPSTKERGTIFFLASPKIFLVPFRTPPFSFPGRNFCFLFGMASLGSKGVFPFGVPFLFLPLCLLNLGCFFPCFLCGRWFLLLFCFIGRVEGSLCFFSELHLSFPHFLRPPLGSQAKPFPPLSPPVWTETLGLLKSHFLSPLPFGCTVLVVSPL